MQKQQFAGKTALITGSGAGIGRASAAAFAARGARVMVCDIDGAAAEETAHAIHAAGGEVEAMRCDATKWSDVEGLVARTVERFGGLDFAHNNVGCGVTKPFEDIDEQDFHFISDTTFKSVFLGLRLQLPALRARGGGAIVNTASMAGISTTPGADMVYSGAKAAVIQVTAYAARMFSPHNIRVNCVAPGLVATRIVNELFTPEQQVELASGQLFARAIQPEEVAAAVMYLCSDDAAMITGVVLPVDGGINAIR